MLSRSKAVFGLLKRVRELDSTKFEDRLCAQKILYILQQGFGFHFDYNYEWYLYGPYSSKLSQDFYNVKNTYNLEEASFKSKDLENKFINALNFFKEVKPNRHTIELLATIIFSNKELKLNEKQTLSSIRERKPYFSEKEVKDAWNLLTEKKLIC